jgi:hypothetical protein
MRKNSVGKEVRMEPSAIKIALSWITSRILVSGLLMTAAAYPVSAQTNQPSSQTERSREKAYLRQQFVRHFRNIQVSSQNLLKAQEEGKLSSKTLVDEAREINKSARALRSLIGLGALAQEVELKTKFSTATDCNEAIELLARLVRKFARNPSHQNSRILNTDQATEAQTDLLSVIRLSKAITGQASHCH